MTGQLGHDAPPRILVVDDEPVIRQTLSRGFWEAGFPCISAANGEEALARLAQHRFAVMLCDIRMPGMDGIELLRHALHADPNLTVIMVTAIAGLQTALGALRAGAYDYVTKPFEFAEVLLAVERAIEYRRLRLENHRYVSRLEDLVEERSGQVKQIAVDVITSLGLALEAKDEWTHSHSRRVADAASALGSRLGLRTDACADLRLGGMLHDIGKIGVREAVLHKPGPLTPAELDHVKLHPELGARILSPLRDLERVIPFIRSHHERWDGGGYPEGLRGDDIPYGARIIGVADVFVAMREQRPYRDGIAKRDVLDHLRRGAGRLFDADIVHALLALDQAGVLDRLETAAARPRPLFDLNRSPRQAQPEMDTDGEPAHSGS